MSATLHFPSEERITQYLEKHPMTNNSYLKEKKITETIAKVFADQDKYPEGIDVSVILTLYDLNKRIHLPETALKSICLNLTEALKDCANGVPIVVELTNT